MLNSLTSVVVVVQVISALAVIGLVLLQHGKGADMGASFGSGASGSLFGATGSSNFMSKSTGVAAAIFFGATLVLTYVGSNKAPSVGVMDNVNAAKIAPANASATIPVDAPIAAPAVSAAVASSSTTAASVEIPK